MRVRNVLSDHYSILHWPRGPLASFPSWPLPHLSDLAGGRCCCPATTPAGLRSLHLAFSCPIHHTPFHLTCPISSPHQVSLSPPMRRPFRLCSPCRIAFSSSSYSPDYLLPSEVSPPPFGLVATPTDREHAACGCHRKPISNSKYL